MSDGTERCVTTRLKNNNNDKIKIDDDDDDDVDDEIANFPPMVLIDLSRDGKELTITTMKMKNDGAFATEN